MKYFVILSLFFVYVNAIDPKVVQAFMEKVTQFAGQCMAETKATDDDMAKLMAHEEPATHEGKCMISCMYKKFGIQNDDGTMNPDEGMNMISKIKESDPDVYEKMVAVVNKCRDSPVDEDHCITALDAAKCLIKEAKEMGLPPDMMGM
uniref:Odorant-binding protein n=1 Tax=Galeruca daurica TaxID=1651263 RepID=A0A1U9W4Z3_9CUCU|nr:odorant-binding protein [Galeruca daurica]